MGCGSSSAAGAVVVDGNNQKTQDDVFANLLNEFAKLDEIEAKEKMTNNKASIDSYLTMSTEPGTGFHDMIVQATTKTKAYADEKLQQEVISDAIANKLGGIGSGSHDDDTTTAAPCTPTPTNSKDKNNKNDAAAYSPLLFRLRNVCAAPLLDDENNDWKNFRPPYYEKSNEEIQFLKKSLKNNFCFSTLSSKELLSIIMAFQETKVYNKGSVIIEQGELTADYFYVIKKGVVRYEINGQTLSPNQSTATRGNSFGELALLYTSPRSASVIVDSTDGCIFYKVDQKTFRYILQMQTIQSDNTKYELLGNVNFISQELDPSDISKLINNLQPRKFVKDELLVEKGSKGDYFFVIQEGKIQVTDITIGKTTYENQILGVGDFFGERALITQEPRSANCIAVTDGIVLTIDKTTFETTVGKYSKLVLKSQDKRQLAAIKIIQNSFYQESTLAALASHIEDKTYKPNDIIMKQGDQTDAALYLVRKGKIQIENVTATAPTNGAEGGGGEGDSPSSRTVESGGYFGEEMLTLDLKKSPKNGGHDKGGNNGEQEEEELDDAGTQLLLKETSIQAQYTATAVGDEDVVVGVLTLKEFRTLADTTMIGTGKKQRYSTIGDSRNIAISSLKKHKILGAGTFGQVWLVSYKEEAIRKSTTSTSRKTPLALKIQSKYELVQNHQALGTAQERNIMSQLQHPFVIRLFQTYQDTDFVYMLLKLVQGGELYSLVKKGPMKESQAKFYAAGIFEGLSYMHRRHILYRDLKPENVLIDNTGYPCIVDLGFAKFVTGKTYTLCGTPLYLAPEVITNRGHDKGADHWSFAVLLYEMLTGYTPFYRKGMDQMMLYRHIVICDYELPKPGRISDEAASIIKRILISNPAHRLGSLARGIEEIYTDDFFSDIGFNELRRKELPPPWIPDIKDPLDTSKFDNWDHLDDKCKKDYPKLSNAEQKLFENF